MVYYGFLQEVWVRKDADLIAEVAAQGDLKYSHHFVAGMFGSGLITLSRYPITEAGSHYRCMFMRV